MKLLILAVFSLVLIAGCVQNSAQQQATASPTAGVAVAGTGTLTVNVTVNAPEKNYYYSKIVEAQKGETAFSVSAKALEIQYKNYSFGAYVYSVQGISDDAEGGFYWQYYYNNRLAPVGVSDFKITDEGTLEWRLENPDMRVYEEGDAFANSS
ncbi:MAG: DUF4430 domain-containing protein [Candidatus Micrarchaeota archaeon]